MSIEPDRLISPAAEGASEAKLDRSLRPATLDEYVGQEPVREQMGCSSKPPAAAGSRWTTPSSSARRVWARPPWPI